MQASGRREVTLISSSDAERSSTGLEVELQVPSSNWLQVHGLVAQNLTLDQLLPSLGFLQSNGHVEALDKSVSSQYADGLFVQHQDSSGNIYNLSGATPSTLDAIESDLQKALALFKARHSWLTTGSRLSFGVIHERKVVVVLDSCATEHAQLNSFLDVAVAATKEQLCRVESFNLIRCCSGVEAWSSGLREVSEDSISSAVQWLQDTKPQTVPFKTNVVEGVVKALAHSNTEGVYLLAQGDCTLRAFDLLLEKVSPSLIPVHLVVYDCKTPQGLEQYKQLANASSARCHKYTPPPVPSQEGKTNPLLSSFSSLSSAGSHSPPLPTHRPQSGRSTSSTIKPRPQIAGAVSLESASAQEQTEDVLAVLKEIELTRNTLAEVQALHLEMSGEDLIPVPPEPTVSEDSLTSHQWLEIHGIRAKKLRYEDLVSSLAFQHCNGTVTIPAPKYKKSTQTIEVVPHTKIVHAQYCKDFVHIRWNEGKTVHVQLTGRAHRTYRAKVEDIISRSKARVAWLKKGSRQLFGTLLESRVVIVIDTSSSVKERLSLIKTKVEELLQEQLSQKKEFTIIHFNSEVHPWRVALVPTSPQNLQAVGQWVRGLLANGSTNTLGALEVAMSVHEAEAVYLLTDGRPDQPLDEVLARVQQLPRLPVHTISFNCADSKANFFLAQLASNTGGRYYYFSEDTSDPEGPNTYQSEDIQKLEEEIEYCQEQLQLADHLLSECNVVRKRGKKRGGARKPAGVKTAGASSKRVKNSRKLLCSKKWLEKNSLKALHLTLMDAFGPTHIPHTSKHVSMLGKQVSSKVFNSLFPLAHVTNGDQVTLINPNGVNLTDYEERLDRQLQIYWDRLSKLAWSALSEEQRTSLTAECGQEGEEEGAGPGVPSYREHRDKLREVMSECSWPHPQRDFDLLENEIDLGNNFKKYLKALKKEAVKSASRSKLQRSSSSVYRWSDEEFDGSEVVGLYSPSTSSSLMRDSKLPSTTYPVFTTASTLNKKQSAPFRRYRKGQHVVVRPSNEAFYYPGVIVGYPDGKATRVTVELFNKDQVTAPTDDIIIVGGAGPCPVLAPGDYVLARVRTKGRPHPSDDSGETCDCYIPGTVEGLPENTRKGGALYLVLEFSGRGISCPRHGIIRIGKSKYEELLKLIKEKGTRPPQPPGDPSPTSSHSGSRLSSARGSIHIPCVDSLPHPSPHPSPLHTTKHRTSSAKSGSRSSVHRHRSHSGSRRASSASAHSSASRGPQSQGARALGQQNHSSQGSSEELKMVLEQQKLQGELLETQQRELSLMLLRQRELEEEMKREREVKSPPPPSRPARGAESPDFFQTPINTDTEAPVTSPIHPTPPPSDPAPADVTSSSEGEGQGEGSTEPVLREQAVNTDVIMEDRGVVTDPMKESRGVGTEWSDSSTEEPESDLGTEEQKSDLDTEEPGLDSGTEKSDAESEAHETVSVHSQESQEGGHVVVTPPTSLSPPHSPVSVVTPVSTPPRGQSPAPQFETTPTQTTPVHNPSLTLVDPQSSYYPTEEEDPLVNQHVLARWPDDGWYYRAVVVCPLGQMWYQVQDASQDTENIHAVDILIDLQDAQKPLAVGDTVTALHPCYEHSYAPGRVTGMAADGFHFSVTLYDGTEGFLPRQEVYHLAPAKHSDDVRYLRRREEAWVGQAVLARRDKDGLYVPGEVLKQLPGACLYLVEWADGSTQQQEVVHMFGKLTKKRGLRQGDHILALAMPSQGVFMPGTIQEKVGQELLVEFCDGERSLVEPTRCFWLSSEYYQQAVEFIAENVSVSSESLSTVGRQRRAESVTESELSNEYTPSYLQ